MSRIPTSIGLPESMKKRLEEIAKEENRSLNNLIVTILRDALHEVDEVEGKERVDYVE